MSANGGPGSVLAEMERLACIGAYAEAAGLADALPPAARADPAVALKRARMRMRQGRIRAGMAALAEADLARASVGERLVIRAETACGHVFLTGDVPAGIAQAERALAAAPGAGDGDRAEAEWVLARMRLIARALRQPAFGGRDEPGDGLATLANRLDAAGRTDRALVARFTHAQQQPGMQEKLAALHRFVPRAEAGGRSDLAAEARLERARTLLAGGGDLGAVRAELDAAAAQFAATGHRHGPIDVDAVRARAALDREMGPIDPLRACRERYRQADYPRGEISVLMDLSTLAHERGDVAGARQARDEVTRLAGETGMGLIRGQHLFSEADLLLRNAAYSQLIEWAEAALADEPPDFFRAGLHHFVSTARSAVGDPARAGRHAREAVRLYEQVGDTRSASVSATLVAGNLLAERSLDEAEAYLREWQARDEAEGDLDASLTKREVLVQALVERSRLGPDGGAAEALARAERELDAAGRLARRLRGREAARRLGGLSQLRGLVRAVQGDEAGVESAYGEAAETYEQAGFATEAANSHYILGVHHLNLATRRPLPHVERAGQHLERALRFYDGAAMRREAGKTHQMIAQLCVNAAVVLADQRDELTALALEHLTASEAQFDAIRREFMAPTPLEAQSAKRVISEPSRSTYALALQVLLLERRDAAEAWRWAQRAKARALADTLGTSGRPPARVLADLERHPEAARMVRTEQSLALRVAAAPARERPELRQELARLHTEMAGDGRLDEYMELRSGVALDRADLDAMMTAAAGTRPWVCVDWVQAGPRLALIAVRRGETPSAVLLDVRAEEVDRFVARNLNANAFRATLRNEPERLRPMDRLVAPLAELTQPEDLLVLCPTGSLHAIPLHALTVGAAPLLARNPVVYTPSLTALRHCVARRRGGPLRTAALFADPGGDRGEAVQIAEHLGTRLDARTYVGQEVTTRNVAAAAAGRDLVHFHGHARHDPTDPLRSHLRCADGPFTARDVFGLAGLRADLVALPACESAASVVSAGDEPLGLIPAFLVAGASAVLATLWRVHRESAAAVMEHVYERLLEDGAPVDRAQALRSACLLVRESPEWSTPYHWAPFVLHGAWH